MEESRANTGPKKNEFTSDSAKLLSSNRDEYYQDLSEPNGIEEPVEHYVINPGSKNEPRVAESVAIQDAKKILENILIKMGIKATVNVEMPLAALDEDGEVSPVVFNIIGGDQGVLIGRKGQTIDALQYILRLILSRKIKSRIPVMVDVENYRRNRYDDLKTLALNVAEQVKTKKTSVRLEPMSAFERRIIHLTLANDPDVMTESIGEGEFRKVVVMPRNKTSRS